MKSLKHLLDEKRRDVVSVGPADTVLQALNLMARHDIGALLVMEQGKPVGIFSERDYARKVVLRGKTSKDTPVAEVMSEKVIYVTLSQTVEECMAIMTDRHVRHLPVLDEAGAVVGFLSIGDMVKETISQQKFIIEQLERYITS
ncbi:MAG: CBS domain-containing protein [Holophaga sp.]|nr:CBS domain-containing protein [Holophaga sp.]